MDFFDLIREGALQEVGSHGDGQTFYLVMNGKSLSGIINDIRSIYGVERDQVFVVTRPGDRLAPPDGLQTIEIQEKYIETESWEAPFSIRLPSEILRAPRAIPRVRVVANGGTTIQLLPVVMTLLQSGVGSFEVVDLQPDGVRVLLRRDPTSD
jgi:hypothetical protein